jgi:hypothetical protein
MFDYTNWRIVPGSILACLYQLAVLSIVGRRNGV